MRALLLPYIHPHVNSGRTCEFTCGACGLLRPSPDDGIEGGRLRESAKNLTHACVSHARSHAHLAQIQRTSNATSNAHPTRILRKSNAHPNAHPTHIHQPREIPTYISSWWLCAPLCTPNWWCHVRVSAVLGLCLLN